MSRHDEIEKPRNFQFLAELSWILNSSFKDDFRVWILEKKLSQIRVSCFFFLNQIRVSILSIFYFRFGADFHNPTY